MVLQIMPVVVSDVMFVAVVSSCAGCLRASSTVVKAPNSDWGHGEGRICGREEGG